MSGVGPAVSSVGGSLLAAGRPRLTLYLDVVSPFAYIAFWVTRVSCHHSERVFQWEHNAQRRGGGEGSRGSSENVAGTVE